MCEESCDNTGCASFAWRSTDEAGLAVGYRICAGLSGHDRSVGAESRRPVVFGIEEMADVAFVGDGRDRGAGGCREGPAGGGSGGRSIWKAKRVGCGSVSYTHLRAHDTGRNL